jgi:hypothetical protein
MSILRLVGHLAGGARDAAAQAAISHWLKRRTQAIRRMTNLRIDTREKSVSLEIDLVGEPEPIRFEVGRYRLIEENGKTFIEVSNVRSSKPWMDILAQEYANGRRFEIPAIARAAL